MWQGTGGVLLPFLGLGTMRGDQQWMVVNFKPVAFQWALREKGRRGGTSSVGKRMGRRLTS
jgi:hypothetical protein